MANALTISRIVLSVVLLALPVLSPGFLAVYALAGVTDMLDGFVARRACTVSELGVRLDSIADFVLAVSTSAAFASALLHAETFSSAAIGSREQCKALRYASSEQVDLS